MPGKRSNGEGTLRKRSNGLWECTMMVGYKDDGTRRYKSFYGKSQQEAKDKADAYKQEVAAGLYIDPNLTFQAWAQKWQGHALALFTSYAAMPAVKERLQGQGLAYPLFTMGRSAIHTTEQFKAHPGSVLLATGAAWDGFDFPGDCVSLLIIPACPSPSRTL